MSLPCVKFISHLASYLAFIVMILASNLRFTLIETRLDKFSCTYLHLFDNFTLYVEKKDLKYQPQFNDFYLRSHVPSELDVLITVWILGNR